MEPLLQIDILQLHLFEKVDLNLLLFVMESVNKKQPIAWLRLKNKNDNDFKPAFNDKEVSTLISKGYKIAKRFSKEEKSYIISQGYEVS